MAVLVMQDPFLSIDAVDLSDHVRSITLNYEAEAQDATASGDTTRVNLGGLKNWSLEIEFNQDYAASSVDATLFAKVGSTVAIEVRPHQTAVGATNPKFTGNGVLTSYPPIGGSVGDMLTATASIVAAGDLTRATA